MATLLFTAVNNALPSSPPQQCLFCRTVVALEHAPELQNAFASVALLALAQAYYDEAERAREEISGQNGKLRHWANAVEQQARDLLSLQQSAALGVPVRVFLSPLSRAVLDIGGRRILLTHPRPALQVAMESQIVERFCQTGACESLTLDKGATGPPPPTAAEARLRWEFSEGGAICRSQGLGLIFSSTAALAESRALCDGFFRELNALLAALRWQVEHGVAISWPQLYIENLPAGSHLLVLNSHRDSTVAKLPLLGSDPALLAAVQPWLAAKLAGKPARLTLKLEQYRLPSADIGRGRAK